MHDDQGGSEFCSRSRILNLSQCADIIDDVAPEREQSAKDRRAPGIEREHRRKNLFFVDWRNRRVALCEPGHKWCQTRDFFRYRNWAPIRAGAFTARVNDVGASSNKGLGLSNCMIYVQAAIARKRIVIDIDDTHH
jgi:hypothetical protein